MQKRAKNATFLGNSVFFFRENETSFMTQFHAHIFVFFIMRACGWLSKKKAGWRDVKNSEVIKEFDKFDDLGYNNSLS